MLQTGCKPSLQGHTTARVCPGKWWQPRGQRQRETRQEAWVIKCRGKYSRKEQRHREGEGLGFQERYSVISKCFFALSGCLTKAGGEFHWRIRLVAFLWPLTSGGFGLCLESQWSNRHVCHFVEQSIDCGRGNNASSSFFFLNFIYIYISGVCSCCGWSSCTRGLQFDALYHFWKRRAEECTWGFTWAHGRKLNFLSGVSASESHRQTLYSIYHPAGFIRRWPQIF